VIRPRSSVILSLFDFGAYQSGSRIEPEPTAIKPVWAVLAEERLRKTAPREPFFSEPRFLARRFFSLAVYVKPEPNFWPRFSLTPERPDSLKGRCWSELNSPQCEVVRLVRLPDTNR
jgi:hypothetical protein